MSDSQPDHTYTEVDLFDVLAARVRAGEPIYITGPLEGEIGRIHSETVNRLRSATGRPVRVIYN